MFNSIKILRDADPAGAANGNGNGAVTLPPAGPVSPSAFGKLLERLDPKTPVATKEPVNTPPAGGTAPPTSPVEIDGQGNTVEPGSAESSFNTDGSRRAEVNEKGEPVALGSEESRFNEDGTLKPEFTGTRASGGDAGKGDGLDETTRAHVKELADLIAKGELSVGEVKRIKKLIAQRGDVESQLEILRERNAELEQKLAAGAAETPSVPGEENPFSKLVKDGPTLAQAKREMYNILEWCEDNADGGVREGKEYTPEEVKTLRREARRAMDIHLPAREKQLVAQQSTAQNRQKIAAVVKQNYPEFYDRETDLGRAAEEFRGLPEVRGRADADVLGAVLALGFMEMKKREETRAALVKNGGGKPQTTVIRRGTNLPPKPGGGAARPANGAVLKRALDGVMKSGSRESLAGALEALGPPGGGPRK